jgi:hypothetical protein
MDDERAALVRELGEIAMDGGNADLALILLYASTDTGTRLESTAIYWLEIVTKLAAIVTSEAKTGLNTTSREMTPHWIRLVARSVARMADATQRAAGTLERTADDEIARRGIARAAKTVESESRADAG